MVADELVHALGHGVDKALASGYLEQRIRAHLEAFYGSPEARGLLTTLATEIPARQARTTRKPATPKPAAAGRKTATAKAPATAKPPAKPAARKRSD